MKRDLKAKELQLLEAGRRRFFKQQQDLGASQIQEHDHEIRRLEQVSPHSFIHHLLVN